MNKSVFVFTVLPEHGQYCTYRYSSTSLHDVPSLTNQMHNILLHFACCLGGRGCCLECLNKNKQKMIKIHFIKLLPTSTLNIDDWLTVHHSITLV